MPKKKVKTMSYQLIPDTPAIKEMYAFELIHEGSLLGYVDLIKPETAQTILKALNGERV